MDSLSTQFNRSQSAEQVLYDHFIRCVDTESSDEVLSRFHRLFVDASNYPDKQVWTAIESLISSTSADREFKFVLNRSCHILINRWMMQSRLHPYILELIDLFEVSASGAARSRTTQSLRLLVKQFVETEQYLALKRLRQVMAQANTSCKSEIVPLGNLISRYPCLYDYNLLTEDSSDEQRLRVRTLRMQAQRQFELDLSRYIAHSQCDRLRRGSTPPAATTASEELTKRHSAKNPTLLSDDSLDNALQQLAGKVDGSNTYRDLASKFLTYGKQAPSYRVFKDDLYDYITASIDPRYGKYHFNQQLRQHLDNTLPHCDTQKVSDFLLVETCKKLLNFLVVESPHAANHSRFVDLVGNIGITLTMGLLLKVVLLCRAIRPWLERRFAILFQLHETHTTDKVGWLVDALEHLNIALTTNFSNLNISI